MLALLWIPGTLGLLVALLVVAALVESRFLEVQPAVVRRPSRPATRAPRP